MTKRRAVLLSKAISLAAMAMMSLLAGCTTDSSVVPSSSGAESSGAGVSAETASPSATTPVTTAPQSACPPGRLPVQNATYQGGAVLSPSAVVPDMIVHEAPDTSSPQSGALPWNQTGIVPTMRCSASENGTVWWEIEAPGLATPGWVNTLYLQAQEPLVVVESPCAEFSGIWPEFTTTTGPDPGVHDHVVSLAAEERNELCTIVTIELGEGWRDPSPKSQPSTAVESGVTITPLDQTKGHYALRFANADRGMYGGEPLRGLNVDAFYEHQFVSFGDGDTAGAAFVAWSPSGEVGEVVMLTGSTQQPAVIMLEDPARLLLAIPLSPVAEPLRMLGPDGTPTIVLTELGQQAPGQMRAAGWGIAFESRSLVSVVDAQGNQVGDVVPVAMGNPSVAWSPFEVTFNGLAVGDYSLVFGSSASDQSVRVPFSIS